MKSVLRGSVQLWLWVLIAALGLCWAVAQTAPDNTVRFSTRSGQQAVALVGHRSAMVRVAEHSYRIRIALEGLVGLSLPTFMEAVDTVMVWADREKVTEGFSDCVLESTLSLNPDGSLHHLDLRDCSGKPALPLYFSRVGAKFWRA